MECAALSGRVLRGIPGALDGRFMTRRVVPGGSRHAFVAYGYDVISRTGSGYQSVQADHALDAIVRTKPSQ